MTTISEVTDSTITVIVPFEIRRRNGRPKIVLPAHGREHDCAGDWARGTVIRAIARAWDWRRRLESGEVATLQDLAKAERVTLPFVSRVIRLAYLSPTILERIVRERVGTSVSVDRVAAASLEPWANQPIAVLCPADRR